MTAAGLAVVQDDANFIAIVDPVSAAATAITLPAGKGGKRQFDRKRGNKKHKLDLEACCFVTIDGSPTLLAFGSGSKGRKPRETVVAVRGINTSEPHIETHTLPELYESLRGNRDFSGSEMNIEGVLPLANGMLRLFNRGNGKEEDGLRPENTTADISLADLLRYMRDPRTDPPALHGVRQHELGRLGDTMLGFTDAAVWRDRIVFSAAAEASPDVYADGPVHGSALGFLDDSLSPKCYPVLDTDGKPFGGKIEGIAPTDDGRDLWGVVDQDDPDAPSLLCRIVVSDES